MVRGTLNIQFRLEKSRLIKSTLRPAQAQLLNPENFQLKLQNRFECLGSDVDDYNDGFVEHIIINIKLRVKLTLSINFHSYYVSKVK
jgi:hypothetical protein